jgi:hypothetical protein
MTTRPIKTPDDLVKLQAYHAELEMPFTVSTTKGLDRSGGQNSLAFKWYTEIAQQMGDREAWEVRAHCKLFMGVRMLVTENEPFREQWHRLIKDRFTPSEKLELMVEPHDYPVTRLMKVSQMTRYLETIIQTYAPMGVNLTQPEGKL